MTSCAVLVQGINKDEDYLLKDVKKFSWFKNRYDEVINVPVESVWDKAWFTKIPFIGKSFPAQFLGDVEQFYLKDSRRIEACRKVAASIYEAHKKHSTVDLFTHSLGCQIALCSGPNAFDPDGRPIVRVNNFFMLESPMGIDFAPARDKVLSHTERYCNNFIARKIYNVWSSKDFVSKKLNPIENTRAMNVLQRCSVNVVDSLDVHEPHNSALCLSDVVKKYKELELEVS